MIAQTGSERRGPGVGPGTVRPDALVAYLEQVMGGRVTITSLRPLADVAGGSADARGLGYGVPFEVECLVGDCPRRFVVTRTRPSAGLGHEYPADRAWQAIQAHAAYNGFPRHVPSVDVGVVRSSGALDSVADATELFQLVETAEGAPYWLDLERLLDVPLGELDVTRVLTLGSFLASVHAMKATGPTLYQRRVRELVGHGEGLMGVLDSYPHGYPLLPLAGCEELEHRAVSWRWRLRGRHHRLSRTHGDFHPSNLLFRARADFSVLHRSRGEWGEPADDVAALAITYLFFGLRASASRGRCGISQPFLDLFRIFLDGYLCESKDWELLEVLPPFLAFRALVLAHPGWHPGLDEGTRRALLGFAATLLEPAPFDHAAVARLLGEEP